jgi:3-oxoacyl-[acyl-carrier protein] reductase
MSYGFEDEDENEFLNKKIIVTGASSGIGLSVSLYFLNCGAQVIMAGQDIQTMKKICEDYRFSNATIMKLDLSNDISIYDFKTSVVERFKTIDILINCAGVKFDGDIEKTYPQDFDYTMDVNLRAVYYLIYNLSGFMERNASIINMSCLYGSRPMSGLISYSVSKAGLEALTRYVAAEFAPIGIRINAISACPVDTNSLRLVQLPESEIEYFNKKMEKNIPLGRIARPDDITKVIAFLASDRSKNITGQIIKVDGGRSLTSSGYVHYKGMKNMNSRFEPDGEKVSSWFGNLFKYDDKNLNIPKDEKELKKFINQKIKESNFSTNLEDAHKNNSSYKSVDINDQKLKEKFLQGKNPNPLYDSIEKNQIKYGKTTFGSLNNASYNNSFQKQIPIKQNMSYNINNNYINKKNEPMNSINNKMNNDYNNLDNNYEE